jgi:hypothetical protein
LRAKEPTEELVNESRPLDGFGHRAGASELSALACFEQLAQEFVGVFLASDPQLLRDLLEIPQ